MPKASGWLSAKRELRSSRKGLRAASEDARVCVPRVARRGGVAREHFRGSDGFLTPVRTGERRCGKYCE